MEQIKALQAENKERVQAYENYKAEKAAKLAELAEDSGDEDDGGDAGDEEAAPAEVTAEAVEEDAAVETEETPEVVEEPVPVTASAPRFSRTPPAPARERIVVEAKEEATGPALGRFGAVQGRPSGSSRPRLAG